jgi:hypothetical protein
MLNLLGNPKAKRVISAVLMPFSLIFIQFFLKWALEKDIDNIGTSLSAMAMGQVFPFIIYDHLMFSKFFSFEAKHETTSSTLKITQRVKLNKNIEQVDTIKNLTIMLFVIILVLFLVATTLGLKGGYENLNFLTGLFAVLLSTSYLISI